MKSCRVNYTIMFAIVVAFIPAIAWANFGTPYVYRGPNLFGSNILLGVFEGILLNLINKYSFRKLGSIGWMILANFVSAGIGLYIINWMDSGYFLTINNLKLYLVGLFVGAWLFTIIIEWPFIHYALKFAKKEPVARKISFKSSLIIQTISYALLAYLYFSSSNASLVTSNKVDSSMSFVKNVKAVVYYTNSNESYFNVFFKINIDGTGKKEIYCAPIVDHPVFSLKQSKDKKYLDLYDVEEIEKPKLLVSKVQRITEKTRYVPMFTKNARLDDIRDDYEKKTNHFRCSDFYISSINNLTGEVKKYSVITPIAMWDYREMVLIPDNIIVSQILNQIVVWDYNNKKIGLLTKGSSPVVIYN